MKYNFKTGLIMGACIAVTLVISSYFYIQTIITKSEDISNFNFEQLDYVDLDGNEISLEEYADKTLLINFWATWCKPCIAEFPILNDALELINDDFVFIMVSYESVDKIKQFKNKHDYNFIFLKSNNFMLEGITTVPQSFILDKNKNIVHHQATIFKGEGVELADAIQSWTE